MMDVLYTVNQVCELLQVKDPRTARRIMREEMEHIERPQVMVSERALSAWLQRNTLPPLKQVRQSLRRKGA